MNKRTTQKPTRQVSSDKPSPRRRRRKLEVAVQEEQRTVRKRRSTRAGAAAEAEEPSRSARSGKPRRKRTTRSASPTKTIVLAMSPNAANILRALLGRARYDEPELDLIKDELDSQL